MIFALLLLSLSTTGCIKTTCLTCQTEQKITYSDGRKADVTTVSSSVCDPEISRYDYEKANSYTQTVVADGVTMLVEVTTTCSK